MSWSVALKICIFLWKKVFASFDFRDVWSIYKDTDLPYFSMYNGVEYYVLIYDRWCYWSSFFPDPQTEISGPPEVFLSKGSTLNLTCIIRNGPASQPFIIWTHNSKVGSIYFITKYILVLLSQLAWKLEKVKINLTFFVRKVIW